jgi:ATP-grasp domain, R2K clade family 3
VLHGRGYARSGDAPTLVDVLAKRIDSPFFSADLVLSEDGELRLVELGDGQVSDRKKWPADRFASMLPER